MIASHHFAAAALGALAVLIAKPDQAPNRLPLEGSSLVLRDEQNMAFAVINKTKEHGPTLELNADNGRPRVRLQMSPDGTPSLNLLDAAGAVRVELSVLTDQTPRILLRDTQSTERIKLFLMPNGSPLVYLKDKTGINRVELAMLETGLSGLVVFDEQSKPRQLVGSIPGTGHGLAALDSNGALRLQWTLSADDQIVLVGNQSGPITPDKPAPKD